MIRLRQSLILVICLLCGCEKYYLAVKRESVDRSQLASTFVGSPDPRQENPPKGQKLILEWRLPPPVLENRLSLVLNILYKNHERKTIVYPIKKRRGIIIYSVLGKEYRETEGFLTYKAEVIDQEGKILKEWKQQLWTDLIVID